MADVLERQYRTVLLLCFFCCCSSWALVWHFLEASTALYSLALTLLVAAAEMWILRGALEHNRVGQGPLLPNLGYANALTLTRGFLLAVIAGFLVLTAIPRFFQWGIAVVYTLAVCLDGCDGAVARITKRQTKLGEILDLEFDALAMLIGTLLSVRIGQLPAWYLVVGFLRYGFVFGIWMRRKLGKTMRPLTDSAHRRTIAGIHMAVVALSLYPFATAETMAIVATIAMVPFCIGFARDWLVVGDILDSEHPRYRNWRRKVRYLYLELLPLALRLSLGLWLGDAIVDGIRIEPIFLACSIAMVTGIAGRTAAIVGTIAAIAFSSGEEMIFVGLSSCLVLTGMGSLSLWKSEEQSELFAC